MNFFKNILGPNVKRRYQRKELHCQASLFKGGGQFFYVNILQISEGGLLFSSPKMLEVEEVVEVQFSLKASGVLSLRGPVIYNLRNEEIGEVGLYGMRFLGLEIFDKLMIQECVRSHEMK